MRRSLLRVRELKVEHPTDDGPVRAVDGASFELGEGEVLALVGESGSGKSQAMLGLLGLLPPPAVVGAAEASFHGVDLVRCDEATRRRLRGDRVAMIFQDPMTTLHPLLTIERQLTEVLEEHRGLSGARARLEALAMLDRVGIPDPVTRLAQVPYELSGGMRQRVVVAMALLCRPALLIADEPTTALDVTVAAELLQTLRELRAASGAGMILVSHDLGVVAGEADRVAVLYAGRVVEQAPVEALFEAPLHPYTRGLLGAVPGLDAAPRARLVTIGGQPPDPSRLPSGCPFRVRCPVAVARCARERPAPRPVDGGREVACHLP